MTGKQSKTHAGDDRNKAQNAYLYLPENNAKCTSVITGKQHKIHAYNDKNNIKILSDAQFKIRMVLIFLQGPSPRERYSQIMHILLLHLPVVPHEKA
jgi:hypothetical protein